MDERSYRYMWMYIVFTLQCFSGPKCKVQPTESWHPPSNVWWRCYPDCEEIETCSAACLWQHFVCIIGCAGTLENLKFHFELQSDHRNFTWPKWCKSQVLSFLPSVRERGIPSRTANWKRHCIEWEFRAPRGYAVGYIDPDYRRYPLDCCRRAGSSKQGATSECLAEPALQDTVSTHIWHRVAGTSELNKNTFEAAVWHLLALM